MDKKIYMVFAALAVTSFLFYFFNVFSFFQGGVKVSVGSEKTSAVVESSISRESQSQPGPQKFGTVDVVPGGITQADITISGGR